MRNAHKILGVQQNATKQEIKRAYRLMAKKFHPDVNPNADVAKFQLIQDAYEYLMNPPKVEYRVSRSTSSAAKTGKNQEARMDDARKRYKEQQYKEYVETHEFFERLFSGNQYKVFRFILGISLVLSLVLISDFIIPGNWEKGDEILIHSDRENGAIAYKRVVPIRVNDEDMFIPLRQLPGLYGNQFIAIEKGKITRMKKKIAVIRNGKYHKMNPPFSYASSVFLIHLVLAIPLVTFFLRKKRNMNFLFLFRISLFVIPVFYLIMLLFYL